MEVYPGYLGAAMLAISSCTCSEPTHTYVIVTSVKELGQLLHSCNDVTVMMGPGQGHHRSSSYRWGAIIWGWPLSSLATNSSHDGWQKWWWGCANSLKALDSLTPASSYPLADGQPEARLSEPLCSLVTASVAQHLWSSWVASTMSPCGMSGMTMDQVSTHSPRMNEAQCNGLGCTELTMPLHRYPLNPTAVIRILNTMSYNICISKWMQHMELQKEFPNMESS